jgi:hypothetical protein
MPQIEAVIPENGRTEILDALDGIPEEVVSSVGAFDHDSAGGCG